eukprot:scaffold34967_cov27-Phaeocystis_antarctica.AAC.1
MRAAACRAAGRGPFRRRLLLSVGLGSRGLRLRSLVHRRTVTGVSPHELANTTLGCAPCRRRGRRRRRGRYAVVGVRRASFGRARLGQATHREGAPPEGGAPLPGGASLVG